MHTNRCCFETVLEIRTAGDRENMKPQVLSAKKPSLPEHRVSPSLDLTYLQNGGSRLC